ncbi:hypothetical protein P7C70_g3500, partial [Phenoliferia sp. Uapishka_3]
MVSSWNRRGGYQLAGFDQPNIKREELTTLKPLQISPPTPPPPPPTPLTSLSGFSGYQWSQPPRKAPKMMLEDIHPIPSQRRLKLLLLLSVTLVTLIFLGPRSLDTATLERYAGYRYSRTTKDPPPTRVGERKFKSLYHGKGCNSSELLVSLEQARISPNGATRYERDSSTNSTLDLSRFSFSYELANCPQPHIFTPEETCDLLGAFGGVFLRGDSLIRHLAQSLFFLLTDSLDVVRDNHDHCMGESLFTHGRVCRFPSYFDMDERETVCGFKPSIKYEQVWRFNTAPQKRAVLKPLRYGVDEYPSPSVPVGGLTEFLESVSPSRKSFSPLVILAFGIHFDFSLEEALDYHINPYLMNTSALTPKPVSLWSSYSAPSKRKPAKFLGKQGGAAVQKFNKEIQEALPTVSPGEVPFGALRSMEWYGVTDGAYSYDGTHHSYLVNMEKAQMLLNLLDTIWGEIVEAGGLVAGSP